MLKGIDPLLGPDLLQILAAMGHGDELVVCDANFPADAIARRTASGRLVRLGGADLPSAIRAILSLLPLDGFVETPAWRMAVVGRPDEIPPVQQEAQAEIDRAQGKPSPMGPIERFAFYERAARAYAVVATGERRFYGDLILVKGALPPPD